MTNRKEIKTKVVNSIFFIAVDLGQINDYTAITVIERVINWKHGNFGPLGIRSYEEISKELHLRHIERPERGTTYPAIVSRIKDLCDSPQLKKAEKAVVIDITGVGRPVWDMLNKTGFHFKINGISITGGSQVTEDHDIFNVPKRDLVTALQLAFQNGDLKMARDLPNSDVLVKELTNFKVKINLNGHDQYEAWREGVHDDLVLSAAMGVWLASQRNFRRYWDE